MKRGYEVRAESADMVHAVVRQLGMSELTEIIVLGVDDEGRSFQFSVTPDDLHPVEA